jgi:hypothetical protein
MVGAGSSSAIFNRLTWNDSPRKTVAKFFFFLIVIGLSIYLISLAPPHFFDF